MFPTNAEVGRPILLMEAWTGTAPFRRATPEECAAAMREAHPTPSAFDTRLFSLDAPIARALAIEKAKGLKS